MGRVRERGINVPRLPDTPRKLLADLAEDLDATPPLDRSEGECYQLAGGLQSEVAPSLMTSPPVMDGDSGELGLATVTEAQDPRMPID